MKKNKQKSFFSLVLSCMLGAFILSMACDGGKAVDTTVDENIDEGAVEIITVCGDDECNGEETFETCPQDCEPGEVPRAEPEPDPEPEPEPVAVCGDGECNGEETAESCAEDCEAGLPQASLHQPAEREDVAADLTEIIVRFNEPMNLEAIPATPLTVTRVGGEALRGESVVRLTADGSASEVVFTLDDSVNLNHYTEYVIAVSSEFVDQDGHTLAELGAPTSWNITTAHGWDPTFTVKSAEDGETLSTPKAALDANGNAMIVYRSRTAASSNINFERYVNGRLESGYDSNQAIGDIAPTGKLLVDSDAEGNALVVLGQPASVLSAYFNQSLADLDARWGASSNIAAPGDPEGNPSLDMNDNGQAFAVWIQTGYETIYGNYFNGGSWLAAPQKLYDRTANPPRMYASEPIVRINNNGNAKAAWLGGHLVGAEFAPGARIASLRFSYDNEAHSWDLVSYEQVANCGIECLVYDISQVDRHGKVYALWDQNGPDRIVDTDDDGIYVNIHPVGDEWTTQIDNSADVSNPQIVSQLGTERATADDIIIMAWILNNDIRAKVYDERDIKLNSGATAVSNLQLAKGSTSAAAIWIRDPASLHIRRYEFGGSWDSELNLNTVGNASDPFVTMNNSGTILVVWKQEHAGEQTIQARYYR